MDDHIYLPFFLTTFCFLFLILTNLPQSHSQPQDETEFSICRRPFNCGGVSDISYPFWTDSYGRPRYCGGSDQFKLTNCGPSIAYAYPSIKIDSETFEVWEINTTAYTLTMVRIGKPFEDYCSQPLSNITISPPFMYSERVHNITMFDECPSDLSIGGNNFTCRDEGNGNGNNTFYLEANETVLERFPKLNSCSRRIQVPALQGLLLDPNATTGALEEAVNGGFELNYTIELTPECIRCWSSNGICGSDDSAQHQFSCYCPDGSHAADCFPHKNTLNVSRKIAIGVGSAITVLLICIASYCFRSKSLPRQVNFWLTTNSNQDIEAFLKNHGALSLKRYKFSDVKKMTNSFKDKLGQGGFGAVYKGKLLTGCPVAVKILNASKENGGEFINEVASISRTSHVNVVTLLGFCFEGRKKALIYEFMSNGSLEKFIYKSRPETTPLLSWEILYQIAKGIARGLEYLHRGCNTRILHFDIKPHNILLDENFCPKISDFGLAKLCPRKESIISMSDARGTIGYVAPEVCNRHFGGVSHKSDVYSYGMLLLDMVGERKNANLEGSHTSDIYFPEWIYKRLEQGTHLGLDGVVATEENEIAKRMTMIGLWCIQTFPNDRPTMSRVIDMLEGNINLLEMPPKPVMTSPARSVLESSTTSTT